MKKSLLALAVLGAFAGAAQAQSAVTIYGSFDGGVRYRDNQNAAGDSLLTMNSVGTYNSNRIGFKGVEDLGGGLNAHFTLETGFNTGTGGLDVANTLFNRTAAVGLGGGWGSLDFGRQYTVAFKTIANYDTFSFKYPGIAFGVAASAGTRYDNDIQYIGNFGPVTARAEYALGETAGNNSAGSKRAIGATFAQGDLSVGGAYTQIYSAADLKTKHWTAGAAYKFGPARVTAGYADQKATVTAGGLETETKYAWVGLNYAITPAVEVTGAFYQAKTEGSLATGASAEGKINKPMLSVTYAFSKRTNLYALFDRASLSGVARAAAFNQGHQNEVAVGINHLF